MKITEVRRTRLREWFADRSIPEKEKSYISQLISGKSSFGERAARRLERDYGMQEGHLDRSFDVELRADQQIIENQPGYIVFQLLDVAASAGPGAAPSAYPEIVQRISVLESWAHTALGSDLSRIRIISARGTSMQGTIDNGDVLFIDSTVRHYDGEGLYVIANGSDVQVKRLQKLHGERLAIISDNNSYKSEELNAEDANSVVICGRVLAAWSLKKFW